LVTIRVGEKLFVGVGLAGIGVERGGGNTGGLISWTTVDRDDVDVSGFIVVGVCFEVVCLGVGRVGLVNGLLVVGLVNGLLVVGFVCDSLGGLVCDSPTGLACDSPESSVPILQGGARASWLHILISAS